MAENDDDEGFGDFKFIISSSSSNAIKSPDFSARKTTANEDDDWGDFINSNNTLPRSESPVNDIHFDPFPNSSPPTQPDSRVENQWTKLTGALPLSIFGEEEESGAVDNGFNGTAGSFSLSKKDGNLKERKSDLSDLIADLYKQSGKGKEGNGFGLGLDVKKGDDLNPKVDTWNWDGLNPNGAGLNIDGLRLSANAPALNKKDDNLGSNGDGLRLSANAPALNKKDDNLGSNGDVLGNLDHGELGLVQNGSALDSNGGDSDLIDDAEEDDGWEFRGAESKIEAGGEVFKSDQNEPTPSFNVSTLSWDPLSTNVSGIGLNSNLNGENSKASMLNSSLVDENDDFGDDGWEFKTAESETSSAASIAKVESREQGNPKGVGDGMNGPSDLFSTSGEISDKPDEWDLEFSFTPGFGTESKQNDMKNGVFPSPVQKDVDSNEMSWAFKDTVSGNEPMTKEEPKVADASSGVEAPSCDSHIEGNEERLEKQKGALPLTIFGDMDLETDDNSLKYEDFSINKPTSSVAVVKGTHSNISINDLISNLYNQAEKNISLNQISSPSDNGLIPSQPMVDPDLVNDENNFDDYSWEFKDAASGAGGDLLVFGDSYEKQNMQTGHDDYIDFYCKLTTELCFAALFHLGNMKKDPSTVAATREDAEVKAIENEIKDLYNELQKDGIIDKEASENLPSRSIYVGEFAKVLQEKKFQVLESEYHLSEKILLAEKDLRMAMELLKHATSMIKILKLGSVEGQSNYLSLWSKILSVCSVELKHGALIWKQSLEKGIHSQLLSKPQGRHFILALGEIYRVVKIVGCSSKLYRPWILFSPEYSTNLLALVRECFGLWSSSGLEEALQILSDSNRNDLKYDVEALLGSIQSIDDLDTHELYKQVFCGQEPTCCLSGLSAATVPGMKMVDWDGRHYFLTIANLWANLVSHDPPNVPQMHAGK